MKRRRKIRKNPNTNLGIIVLEGKEKLAFRKSLADVLIITFIDLNKHLDGLNPNNFLIDENPIVGWIAINNSRPSYSRVLEFASKPGIGSQVFLAAIYFLNTLGRECLLSDNQQTDKAKKFWDSAKRNLAKCQARNETGIYLDNESRNKFHDYILYYEDLLVFGIEYVENQLEKISYEEIVDLIYYYGKMFFIVKNDIEYTEDDEQETLNDFITESERFVDTRSYFNIINSNLI